MRKVIKLTKDFQVRVENGEYVLQHLSRTVGNKPIWISIDKFETLMAAVIIAAERVANTSGPQYERIEAYLDRLQDLLRSFLVAYKTQ